MKKGDDIEDLMGLIELAEKSTEKLSRLKDQVFNLVIFGFLTIVIGFIFYFLSREYLLETLRLSYTGLEFIVAFFMSVFILPLIRKVIKISQNIQSEIGITDKLYNLIEPLRASLVDEMSIMKMATVEMRLRRIHFEGSNKKHKRFKQTIKSVANSKIQKEFSLET